TLGRLAGALLSEKALSNILTPERLGQEFEAIANDSQAYPVERILRRGHQVGWYSDAETTYGAWRERITTVRSRLLAKVGELTTSDDTAARATLFEDLHGLIASATQLYHAAGLELTTTIRLPDTDALTRNPTQLQDLCTFLAKTVPKQSVYGIHAGYRMLFEDRPAKLRRRLPYEVAPDTQVDLTMSWVLAGPTVTDLGEQITTALRGELSDVRETIADGTEHAPPLKIPVVDGTTYPAI
ncbi:plasmid replication protein RepH, partial [Halorubrum distributum]